MNEKVTRFGVEIEGFGITWDDVCNLVMDSTDDVCMVWERVGGNPLNWTVCHDGTLPQDQAPFELRSPAFSDERVGFERLRAVTRALRQAGGKVNVKCGLHVHHEAAYAVKALGGDMLRLAVAAHMSYAAMEPVLDSFMPRSRRGDGNAQIRTLRSAMVIDLLQREYTVDQVMEHLGGRRGIAGLWADGHHRKLSTYSALAKHCTLEYRQHSGTLQASKIIPWVRLTGLMTHRIVEVALGHRALPTTMRSMDALFDWLEADDTLRSFWRVGR
jgi:hypothetical protein